MSKKKKKDKIDPQVAREKEWLEQFACLGIAEADEVYELIFENDECVELEDEEQENGYPDFMLSKTYQNKNISPETIHISKYKDKYIVWVQECFVDGDSSYLQDEEFAYVCDTLEQARKTRDTLCSNGHKPLDEQIKECKAKLNDKSVYIKMEIAGYYYNFSVFYNRNLIIENFGPLEDTEYIASVIRDYNELESKLKNMGVTLLSIEKPYREWNCNTRYYDYDLAFMDDSWTEKVEITSKMQHKTRTTIDMFPWEKVEKIVKDAKESGKYDEYVEAEKQKREEFDNRYNAALDGILHSCVDSVAPVTLDKKERESLRNYLENDVDALRTCDCTFKHTVSWLKKHVAAERQSGVLKWLESRGGYCDCEILLNAEL